MEKKARVTKITKLDKLDNFGNTTFIAEFDNGEKGFYTSKNPEQTKFIVGNVADYILEVKEGSKGPYNKITVPQTTPVFLKGGGGKPPIDPRAQFIGFSAAYAKDLVVADKLPIGDMNAIAEKIFNNMIRLFNTIK
jgi:hypothetical protein